MHLRCGHPLTPERQESLRSELERWLTGDGDPYLTFYREATGETYRWPLPPRHEPVVHITEVEFP